MLCQGKWVEKWFRVEAGIPSPRPWLLLPCINGKACTITVGSEEARAC
jgi:hypothetical protein